MFEIVIGTVIAFLAITGVVELCRNVQQYFLGMPEKRVVFTIAAKGRDENIEYVIRSIFFNAREQHYKLPDIIVVDDGMDSETREICEKLAYDLGCVRICRKHELAREICGQKI